MIRRLLLLIWGAIVVVWAMIFFCFMLVVGAITWVIRGDGAMKIIDDSMEKADKVIQKNTNRS